MKKILVWFLIVVAVCFTGAVAWSVLFALKNAPAPKYISEKKMSELKDFYMIEMGDDTFRIPVAYLLDSRLRIDGKHEYVPMMAKRKNLEPVNEAKSYNREPNRGMENVEFNLNFSPRGYDITNSLRSDAKGPGTIEFPDLSKEQNGLKKLGVFMLAGRIPINTYAYLENGKIIAVLRCDTYETYENPGCRVNLLYSKSNSIDIDFNIENLDWFISDGMEKILAKVESWRVKEDSLNSIEEKNYGND